MKLIKLSAALTSAAWCFICFESATELLLNAELLLKRSVSF